MIHHLTFESRRIFTVKPWFIGIMFFCLASFFFVYKGTVDYKNFREEKKTFLDFETSNVKKYVTYDQYGGYGFRVLYEPPRINVFFNNSSIFENLYSNIDMTEIIKIDRSYKGRDLFFKKGLFKDLSGIFFVFGSLIMIFLGFKAFVHEKYFFRFPNILLRMAFLDVVFIILLLLLYYIPGLFGLPISQGSDFFIFSLFIIFFLNFFYAAGFFIRCLMKKKLLSVIITFIVWFVSTAMIPELVSLIIQQKSQSLPPNDKNNIKKLDEVMKFERNGKKILLENKDKSPDEVKILKRNLIQDFFKNGYQVNIKREDEINTGVKILVNRHEKYSIFFPTSLYSYTAGEISGKGYSGYLDFTGYIHDLRDNFVKFYIKKKYYSDDQAIENFVKNNENVFKSTSHLPGNFHWGLLLTVFYTVILLAGSYFILKRRLKKKKETFDPGFELAEGDMVYVLCKNDENENYQDKIYNHYEQQENTICVDKIKGQDIDPGISPYQTARYFRKQMNARWDRTREHIEKLGIKDLKKEKRSPEAIKKIYCAVCMAVEADKIVFKDFIKQESRKFERQFLALLKDTMDMDRTIIYLGTDPLLLDSPFTTQEGVDKFRKYEIDDPLKFILR